MKNTLLPAALPAPHIHAPKCGATRWRLAAQRWGVLACLAVPFTPAFAQTVLNATWQGDATGMGNWSTAALWNPDGVPNNGGGNVFNVTIPDTIPGNGPTLDIDVTIANLTASTVSQLLGQPGFDLTVTGTTQLQTGDSFGAVVNADGDVITLGTLANFNTATKTLLGGNLTVGGFVPGFIQFRDADIVTVENAALVLFGAAQFRNQNNGANAIANLAVNNGLVQFADGANFTTVGNFTTPGLLAVTNFSAGASTTFTVGGSLTNFNAATKILTNADLLVSTSDAAAIIRFANADIRTLQNSRVQIVGDNARITDLAGNNALRNLSQVEGSTLSLSGTQIILPNAVAGSAFTNSGSTLSITPGSNVTVQGAYTASSGGALRIAAPTETANTRLTLDSALINGGSIDMGGQPGVNTIYHTELQIINGLEFRGAYTGTGTSFADIAIMMGGRVSPGNSAGQLDFVGALSFEDGTSLQIEIGGRAAGTQFDLLTQSGPLLLTLGGALELSLIDGFASAITSADVFEIVTSENVIAGDFENVASGQRLATTDGAGSFVVTYAGGESVVLSNFQPVPEPSIFGTLLAGVALLVFRRRHQTAGSARLGIRP